jgi:HEAT repeat protein
MLVTMEQVLAELDPDEPDYENAAKLGSEALPHLEVIVKKEDALLASKATYLASFIHDKASVAVLDSAARSVHPEVRVAAAYGSRNLDLPEVKKVLEVLKDDQDENVRNISRQLISAKRNGKAPPE